MEGEREPSIRRVPVMGATRAWEEVMREGDNMYWREGDGERWPGHVEHAVIVNSWM